MVNKMIIKNQLWSQLTFECLLYSGNCKLHYQSTLGVQTSLCLLEYVQFYYTYFTSEETEPHKGKWQSQNLNQEPQNSEYSLQELLYAFKVAPPSILDFPMDLEVSINPFPLSQLVPIHVAHPKAFSLPISEVNEYHLFRYLVEFLSFEKGLCLSSSPDEAW